MVSLITAHVASGWGALFTTTDDGRFELRIVRGRGVHDDRVRFTVGAFREVPMVPMVPMVLWGTFYCGQLTPFPCVPRRSDCGAVRVFELSAVCVRQ